AKHAKHAKLKILLAASGVSPIASLMRVKMTSAALLEHPSVAKCGDALRGPDHPNMDHRWRALRDACRHVLPVP
ncbi:hypothetical protein, partial [uncultured Thiodictyon sp.]|uniref:hypothetical protein n=1 Tax=uncultured Thiodictyon sp. TaxID=1846217 RepID=UPI0025EE29CF